MSGLQLKTKVESMSPPPDHTPDAPPLTPTAAPTQPAADMEPTPTPTPPPLPPPRPPASAPPPPRSPRSVGGTLAGILAVLIVAGGIAGSAWILARRQTIPFRNTTPELGREITPLPTIPAFSFKPALDPSPTTEDMFRNAADVKWPVLVLSGMVAGASSQQTSAILNGTLVSTQESIEGATLIEIRKDGVVLEYKQTRKFIGVGESS